MLYIRKKSEVEKNSSKDEKGEEKDNKEKGDCTGKTKISVDGNTVILDHEEEHQIEEQTKVCSHITIANLSLSCKHAVYHQNRRVNLRRT